MVKPRKKITTDTSDTASHLDEGLLKAIRYTLKYTTKPEDLINTDTSVSQDMQVWLVGLTEQLHNKRAIATGGLFKKYLSDSDPHNLIIADESLDTANLDCPDPSVFYAWRDEALDYALIA